MADELIQVPADLTLMSDEDVVALEQQAVVEFDRLQADPDVTPQVLEYQVRLSNDIDRLRSEIAGRNARAAEAENRARAQMLEQREALEARVHGRSESGGQAPDGERGGSDVAQIAEAAARGATAALVAVLGERGVRHGIDQDAATRRATASLAEARRHAPPPTASPRLAVTAGVDIPGVARGADLTSLDEVIAAFQRTAKSMPVTRDGRGQERLVCTIRNEFEHVVDDRTSPAQVEELLRYLRSPEKVDSLVAAGGWGAPSEIRYDFFNAAGVDGLVSLPTVGVTRGGIRFPTSPSIADAFGANGLAPFAVAFSNTSVPWLWTEADDTAAVTGSPTKPTLRVAIPSFNDVRLECYGITLTAGNLTDDAYPEATSHTLSLLNIAHAHAMNARIISQMVALSGTAVTGIGSATTHTPVFQTVMNGLALAATDYKAKYAIPDDTVIEAVAPFWLRELIIADLAWRQGFSMDLLSVTNAQITAFLADRGISIQWVNDWQVRGSNQFGNPSGVLTAWPTTTDIMLYAAGTFVKGNGLTLDLGVVRDSTLNKSNDFTAAWSEECHLVAKVGNESRLYRLAFNVDGATGNGFYAAGSPTAQI